MKATKLDIDFSKLLVSFHQQRIVDRTLGVDHLSEILHYILTRLEPGRYGSTIKPETAHIGFLLEDTLSWAFSGQFGGARSKQIEVEKDGIYMTLDGFNTQTWRVKEYKATKISAREPITSNKYWGWKIRTAGYCHAMDTLEAELTVMHINGSYELGGGRFGETVFNTWLLRYTRYELYENWQTILMARDRMHKDKEYLKARRGA